MTEEIMTDGLTMEDASPASEAVGEESAADSGGGLTKRMSERINTVRAEAKAEADAARRNYEAEIARRDEMIAGMRRGYEAAERSTRELERLRARELERQKSDVLEQLKREYPDDNIVDIEHFPREFYAMLSLGVDPGLAYAAAVTRSKKTAPPTSGSVRSAGGEDAGYFSRDAVAQMSRAEILKNYDAITASQKKW